MTIQSNTNAHVSADLIDAIRSFPVSRATKHCDSVFNVSPFDIYATCPDCGERIKLRSFSALPDIEDVFDAVFEWMGNPDAKELAIRRLQVIADDDD